MCRGPYHGEPGGVTKFTRSCEGGGQICLWICVIMWGLSSVGGRSCWEERGAGAGGGAPWGQSCGNELWVSVEDELYYRNTELLFWGLIWGAAAAGSPSHLAQIHAGSLNNCWMWRGSEHWQSDESVWVRFELSLIWIEDGSRRVTHFSSFLCLSCFSVFLTLTASFQPWILLVKNWNWVYRDPGSI